MSRGAKTTKIHAVVDGIGNPVHFIHTGGEEHDSKQAISLLSKLKIADSNILADKAYGTADICNYISERGASYVIQPKTNAKEPWDYDIWLYKERHLIECISINSRLFAELLLVMTNLFPLFLPLFTLFLSGFCLKDTILFCFQIRSSNEKLNCNCTDDKYYYVFPYTRQSA